MPEMYVTYVYDHDWFVGYIIQISERYKKCLSWLTKYDQCWVPLFDCLGHIES